MWRVMMLLRHTAPGFAWKDTVFLKEAGIPNALLRRHLHSLSRKIELVSLVLGNDHVECTVDGFRFRASGQHPLGALDLDGIQLEMFVRSHFGGSHPTIMDLLKRRNPSTRGIVNLTRQYQRLHEEATTGESEIRLLPVGECLPFAGKNGVVKICLDTS
jgi:hypothetical protein